MITLQHGASVDDAPALWALLEPQRKHFEDDFRVLLPHFVLEVVQDPNAWLMKDAYGLLIGGMWFNDIYESLHATLHLVVNPKYWRKVLKEKLIARILDEAFASLKVRKFKAVLLTSQSTGKRLCAKHHFVYAGTFRGETSRAKRPLDVIIFELQRKRWNKLKDSADG
jgi:RimJ/RimL family protein N-acetyltransferase